MKKKQNGRLTKLLVRRKAICDKMTHGVPGCSTKCRLYELRSAETSCRDSVLMNPAQAACMMQIELEGSLK